MSSAKSGAAVGVSRRRFVQLGAALAAGVAGAVAPRRVVAAGPAAAAIGAPAGAGKRPKNVIFMVADGMSAGVIALTQRFAVDQLQRETAWAGLLRDPQVARGFFDTASLSSPVTDSAAASTAWGSGSRVRNGAINQLPDGTALTPIAQVVRDGAKKRVGLVTTATVTHATPAGFAAVQRKRDDEKEIAAQYRDVVDIALGGGASFFSRSLLEKYQRSGYTIVRDKAALAATEKGAKVLGTFADAHLPFAIDHANDPKYANVPTLAEMTQTALDSLETAPDGFLLQVEGARVDHAAHANDTPGLIHDQLAFDAAIEVVLNFARRRGDTLVVITTDHGNSNPGLLGMGGSYNDSGKLLAKVARAKASYTATLATIRKLSGAPQAPDSATFEETAAKAAAAATQPALLADAAEVAATEVAETQPATTKPAVRTPPALVGQVVKEKLGVTLTKEQCQAMTDVWARSSKVKTPLHPGLFGVVGTFGQIMVNQTGVAWMGTTHTNDYAVVSAFGPGAERFNGLLLNTQAFGIITELLGCPFKNPAMAPEQAKKVALVSGGEEDFGWLEAALA